MMDVKIIHAGMKDNPCKLKGPCADCGMEIRKFDVNLAEMRHIYMDRTEC